MPIRRHDKSLSTRVPDGETAITRVLLYGTEVEEALVQVWEQSNRLCSKRLIPFLPTVLEVMARHGHLCLTPECCTQLLAMSTATADRLLRSHRKRAMHGPGTLLKQNIPIRTFEQWDE